MLLECRQFEELHSEFDRWLVTVEEELASDPAQKLNTQRLNKQNKVKQIKVKMLTLRLLKQDDCIDHGVRKSMCLDQHHV